MPNTIPGSRNSGRQHARRSWFPLQKMIVQSMGCTPRTCKRLADVRAPCSRSGGPSPVKLKFAMGRTSAMSSKSLDWILQSCQFAPITLNFESRRESVEELHRAISLIRLRVGQGFEQDAIDQAEDRGGQADAVPASRRRPWSTPANGPACADRSENPAPAFRARICRTSRDRCP